MRCLLYSLALIGAGCLPRLDIDVPARQDDTAGPGDGGAGDGGVGDGGVEAPIIERLDPTDGPTNGGTVVAVLGGPFDDSVQVTFDQRGATLATLAEDRITVVAPPSSGGEGSVDVTVRTDGGQAVAADAYTYWDNAGGDTALVGSWLQLVLAGSADTVVQHESWLRFVEPDAVVPSQRYGLDLDTCGTPTNGLTSRQGPASILLGPAGALLSHTWDGARVEYVYQGGDTPPLATEATLQLQVEASTVSPALALELVAETGTPEGPTAPNLALDTPQLDADDATLSWVARGHDHVLVSGQVEGEALFLCVLADDGSYTLPATLFDGLDFASGGDGREAATLWLAFAGVDSTVTALPYNGGVAIIDAAVGVAAEVTVTRAPVLEVAP